ncbi:hypothetical protein [Nitrospira sp. M1]
MAKSKMVLTFLLCMIPIGPVSAEAMDHAEDMRLLFNHSGIFDRLQEFPRQVYKGMGRGEDSSQSESFSSDDAFSKTLNVKEMERELIVQMSKRMDDRTTTLVLRCFQSPLGMRITNFERTTYANHAWKKRQSFLQGFVQNPPDQTRLDQIELITEATYLSRIDEELEITTALALTEAMNARLPKEERIDPDYILHELQSQRNDMKPV